MAKSLITFSTIILLQLVLLYSTTALISPIVGSLYLYAHNNRSDRGVSTNNIMTLSQSLEEIDLAWFEKLKGSSSAEFLRIPEWEYEDSRKEDGFKGIDFCHSKSASVRILDYLLLKADSTSTDSVRSLFPQLVGPAYFSEKSESHRGLCHGGSFCALMDDAIGWLGFCVSGTCKPWSGYTVQVNTSLKKSVKVGSVLKLESWVDHKENHRKYWIKSRLTDPVTGVVHCEAIGLFLLSKEESETSPSSPPSENP